MGKSSNYLVEMNRRKKIGNALRKTHRQFIKEVYNLVGCEYSVLSLYKTTHFKVKVRHNKCGYVWMVTPAHFLSGTRCPKCARNLRRDTKQFKQLVYDEIGNEYTVLGEYINSQTGILMRHNTCGHIWKAHPNHFLLNETRCPVCVFKKQGRKQALTQRQYVEKIRKVHGDEYKVLSKYISGSIKVLIEHNDCGYRWEVYPYNLLRGHGCPKCKSSSVAEDRVYDYLRKKNIKFKHQVAFSDCRNELPLPFDFQILVGPKYFLLELDGQQHHEAIEYWGGEEMLKYVQRNDSIKNEYCRKRNIKLIRIPYWEFDNLEEILERILKNEGEYKTA